LAFAGGKRKERERDRFRGKGEKGGRRTKPFFAYKGKKKGKKEKKRGCLPQFPCDEYREGEKKGGKEIA